MANSSSYAGNKYDQNKIKCNKYIHQRICNDDKNIINNTIKGTDTSQNTDHQQITNIFPEFENIKLPNIELFSSSGSSNTEKNDEGKDYPQITDLCEEDRLRISQLVNEIARYREINIQDTKMITDLQEEKFNMTIEISKLEKDITQLLAKNEEKETELMQLDRKYSNIIQEQKMQFAELKLTMDVNQKHLEEKLKEQQLKNKELTERNEKISNSYKQLSVKYKYVKKKLKKAIHFIQQMKDERKMVPKEKEEKFCQVSPSITPKTSRTNLNKDFPLSEHYVHNENRPNISQSKSELSLLSDLFFKGPSCNPDDDELIIISQDNNFNHINKYL